MSRNKNYTHKELASLYFPGIQPKSSSANLTRWIARDEELKAELQEAGYTRKQRQYSPLQVEILFKHMGDPDTFNL